MSCKHPLKGFQIGLTENGKPNYLITSYSVDHIEKFNGRWQKIDTKFCSNYSEKIVREFTEIPCGNCISCRLEYSRQWANRCMLEYSDHDPESVWFITLTYNSESIINNPIGSNDIYSLQKSDLQKFFKNLRRQVEYHHLRHEENIRYYACGEYGDKNKRPHYHIIIYGLFIDDLTFFQKTKKGYPLFRSEFLEKCWNKGIVAVGKVNWDTCAYTARYVMKKQKGAGIEYYYNNGIEPEFCIMSRRPGIARQYYEFNKEKIYKFDEIILEGGNKIHPPRYFDSRYELDYPDMYQIIKNNRKEKTAQAKKLKMCHTDKSYIEVLKAEEQILLNRIRCLRRDKIEY